MYLNESFLSTHLMSLGNLFQSLTLLNFREWISGVFTCMSRCKKAHSHYKNWTSQPRHQMVGMDGWEFWQLLTRLLGVIMSDKDGFLCRGGLVSQITCGWAVVFQTVRVCVCLQKLVMWMCFKGLWIRHGFSRNVMSTARVLFCIVWGFSVFLDVEALTSMSCILFGCSMLSSQLCCVWKTCYGSKGPRSWRLHLLECWCTYGKCLSGWFCPPALWPGIWSNMVFLSKHLALM